MSKHTPGPWLAHAAEVFVGDEEGYHHRLHLATFDGESDEQREANARLAAAAPDLLAACEAAKAFLAGLGEPTTVLLETKLSAAIRKAKGGGS